MNMMRMMPLHCCCTSAGVDQCNANRGLHSTLLSCTVATGVKPVRSSVVAAARPIMRLQLGSQKEEKFVESVELGSSATIANHHARC